MLAKCDTSPGTKLEEVSVGKEGMKAEQRVT